MPDNFYYLYIVKTITYILFIFFCFICTLTNAKPEQTSITIQLPGHNSYEKKSNEQLPTSIFKKKEIPRQNKLRFVEQDQHRGIVSLYCLVNIHYYLLICFSDKKLYISSHTLYFQRLFFCNGKRGPPSIPVF